MKHKILILITLFLVLLTVSFPLTSSSQTKSRVLKGTEHNPNSSWSAVTDRDTYSPGDKIVLTITNNTYENASLVKNVWIERTETRKKPTHHSFLYSVLQRFRG